MAQEQALKDMRESGFEFINIEESINLNKELEWEL